MKRVAIIGTAGVPGKYGGFETLAHHLVKQLSHDYLLSVYNSNNYYPKEERVKYWNDARIHYIPFNANGAQSIIYDIVSIFHALFKNDVLLILGVSGGILLPFVRLFTRKRIIVNIDGLEWKRQKWGKFARLFLKFSEYLAVKYSHAEITDNMALKQYALEEYSSVSELIEYGADHIQDKPLEDVSFDGFDLAKQYLDANMKDYAMKVCRIEPENNIHVVLEAFSKSPEMKLLMIGNWNNSDYGKKLREAYQTFHNITLFNPIYNQDVLDQLRKNCIVYVHGHSAGGTNPSLVEAMWLGLPIVAFSVVYNKETTEHKAIYFSNTKELEQILEETHLDQYENVGHEMKTIAERRYTWSIIARKYANLVDRVFNSKKKQVVLPN